MLIEGFDYFTYLLPFPVRTPAFSTPNDDGTYSVYINSNMPAEAQRKGFLHELKHILRDDFYSERPVSEIEKECDEM